MASGKNRRSANNCSKKELCEIEMNNGDRTELSLMSISYKINKSFELGSKKSDKCVSFRTIVLVKLSSQSPIKI